LAEEAFDGGLGLVLMNQAPVSLTCHGVFVLLPQETDIVRFLELLHISGVVGVFAIEELNGANVLVAAVDSLHLAVSTKSASDLWGGDAQRKQDEKDQHDCAKEHKALFAFVDVRSIGPYGFQHRKTSLTSDEWKGLTVIVGHIFYDN
jgi:hypothetical protein